MLRLASAWLAFVWYAFAAEYPAPVEHDFVVHDFQFHTGERLDALKLHCLTLGVPERDASGVVRNAVLIMHGTGGSGRGFLTPQFAGVLFSAGGRLDARRDYIILPDAIGHGGSSKPSDGMRARFPRYNYDDLVRGQKRLLEELGVNHLRLVMGTSMGAMHTWMWGEMYPDFMDALMPLASLPVQIAGRNRMMRRMIIEAIRTDPEWKNGAYRSQPRGLTSAIYTLLFMVSSPLVWQREAPTRDAADAYLEKIVKQRLERIDANDMLYQVEASQDYDPSPKLETIQAPLVAINSADDEVNPPELGILDREIRRVKHGKYVLLPTSEKTRGHGTHSLPEVWQQYLAELLKQSAS